MVFNSVIFIFCFLPIFLLIYYFVPARARNPVLFAGSLFFYAWGDPTYLVLMLFSSFFNYYMGKELGKITDEDPSRKRNLIFAVVINRLILGFFLPIRSLHCPSDFLSIPLRICPTSWISIWEKQNPARDFSHMPYTAPCFRT